MDLTAQSSRSSTSPAPNNSSYIYPSPVPCEASSSGPYEHIPDGLGLRNCSISASHSMEGTLVPARADFGPDWTISAYQARRLSRSPNIFSRDLEDISSTADSIASPYSPDLYTVRAASGSMPSTSPAMSCIESSRSSISSTTSEPYPFTDQYHVSQPHIKMEDQMQEWSVDTTSIRSHSQSEDAILMAPGPAFSDSFETNFFAQQDAMMWTKTESFGENFFGDGLAQRPATNQLCIPGQERRRVNNGAVRTKAPRKMTTQEDANFQCSVKGCGKLFSRSYNYKAHLETHSNNREYPFPCQVSGCSKRFVRKTDLQRHHASVHEKSRTHQCDFCSRFFARKDTLRRYVSWSAGKLYRFVQELTYHRHMEDGCPKRFDLNMSFNPSTSATEHSKSKTATHQAQMVPLQSHYGASDASAYPPGSSAESPQFRGNLLQQEYHDHAWNH